MMVKLMTACSPLLLAATIATVPVDGQAPSPARQVTAIGCITRNGVVDVNKGTRLLNMDPNGLALTAARITDAGTNRPSAVPGSAPDGRDSGTIPRETIAGAQPKEPDAITFELTGDQVKALGSQVGRRVEVVGRLTEAARPTEATAHPSTELAKLEVTSFRGATGGCQ
jgi:hypothetical protein